MTSLPPAGPWPWHSFLFCHLFMLGMGTLFSFFLFCASPHASYHTPHPAGIAISSFLLAFPGSFPRNFSRSLGSSCDSPSSELCHTWLPVCTRAPRALPAVPSSGHLAHTGVGPGAPIVSVLSRSKTFCSCCFYFSLFLFTFRI